MLAEAPRDRDAFVERIRRTYELIGSPAYPTDEARLRQIAEASWDRGHNPRGVLRQMHAITASGDRTAALRKLDLPVTVIHGTRDTLIRQSGGRATARAIPGARLRIFEGMGHDLPREALADLRRRVRRHRRPRRLASRRQAAGLIQRFGPMNSSSLATSALRET